MHRPLRILGLTAVLALLMLGWQWQRHGERYQGWWSEKADADRVAESDAAAPALDSAAVATADASTKRPKQNTPQPSREPPPIALDAPALGHRASEAQRLSDLQRMMAAEDLAPLLAEFQRRAAEGDADAAARMRDIYDECLGVHWAQAELMRGHAISRSVFSSAEVPENDPARQAALQIGTARCGRVIPAGDDKTRTIQLGRLHRDSDRLAADLGHPGARVRTQAYEPDPTRRALRERSEALLLLRDGSGEALMELFSHASDATPFRGESWGLAACELGYPCANIPGIRYNLCATYGQSCEIQSLQEFVMQTSSARDWRRFQAERDQILALLQAGDLGALLLSDQAIGGGG